LGIVPGDQDAGMTPYQLRLREAAQQLMLWMRPRERTRERFELLAALHDPEVAGWSLRDAPAYPGVADLVRGDRYIGIVSTIWLETGERPDPWPPAGFPLDYPHAPD
jgi:hypothetical protein